MKKIWIVARNRLKVSLRKNPWIIIVFLAPIIVVAMAHSFNNYSTQQIRIGIFDGDESRLSQDYINALKKNEKITLIDIEEKLMESFVAGSKVHMGIVIPENFQRDIIDGQFQNMEIITLKNNDAAKFIKNYTDFYIEALMDISKVSNAKSETYMNIYSSMDEENIKVVNHEVKDRSYNIWISMQSVGFMTVVILASGMVIGITMIKEKGRRLEKRVFASTINKFEYIMGNVLAVALVNLIQVGIFYITVKSGLVKIYQGEAFIFGMFAVFSLVSAAMCIFICTLRETRSKALRLALIMIVPTSALGGGFWPARLMPEIMRNIGLIFPQGWIALNTYNIQTISAYNDLWIAFLVMALYAVLFFGGTFITVKGIEN